MRRTGNGLNITTEVVVDLTEALQVLVKDVNVGVHAHGQRGRGHTGDTGTEHDDVGRRNAGYARDQHASTTAGPHQVVRTHERCHTTSDFTHRRQEWQGVIGRADGLVRNGHVAGIDEGVGAGATGREVEVRKEDLIITGLQASELGLDRLFDLEDQIGTGPHVVGIVEHLSSGRDEVSVANRRAEAGAPFDENTVAFGH